MVKGNHINICCFTIIKIKLHIWFLNGRKKHGLFITEPINNYYLVKALYIQLQFCCINLFFDNLGLFLPAIICRV
ncbi:hypothetical protein BEL04_20595 [Mucilaginibacter sp. PPCGB 2223]|nr:hypothetical protein BEL04_20595 [Mucilaginibacter sp. PPCGB 2223]